MSILITEPDEYSPKALETYSRLGKVWLGRVPSGNAGEVELLVVRLAHFVGEGFLRTYPKVKAIASPTTGLNHIAVDYCEQRNIRVFSLAQCRNAIGRITSTSELAIGLMLALLRAIPQAHSDVVLSGNWNRQAFRSRQLSALTLGIIGLGRIGGHVAGYAKAFGMRVVACDPHQPDARFTALHVERMPLDDVMSQADIVSIHANFVEENRHMVGGHEISLLRPDALIVNTARGELLDESALVCALREGKMAGAAIDVLSNENSIGSVYESKLVQAARDGLNIIITPHLGGCTCDAMFFTEECLAEVVVEELSKDGNRDA